MSLAELFPDGDYRFHLTLRRTEPREFFAPRDTSGKLLRERERWLARDPTTYAALLPEGEPLLAEFERLLASWGVETLGWTDSVGSSPIKAICQLGARLEPDILFLSPDPEGKFRLRGGALCFPTGWALTEKLGHTLDFIHGVVPGLNAALASPIHQFMAKLKPGVAFLRDNWGLAATDKLNLHPARRIPPPRTPMSLDKLWLRVEHQALLALPESRGIAFGIRIALHRLDAVAHTPAAAGLRRALETMPAELAAYKRVADIRPQIMGLL